LAIEKLTALGFGVAEDEWHVLQTARPNVLLIGADRTVAGFLDLLLPLLRHPITRSRDGARILPEHLGGTLILHDVGRLDEDGQRGVSLWLAESNRDTQVISTASCPLYPLVEREALSAPLYYSLNVLMLTLRDPAAPG
jgi:hypothetical protein